MKSSKEVCQHDTPIVPITPTTAEVIEWDLPSSQCEIPERILSGKITIVNTTVQQETLIQTPPETHVPTANPPTEN